MEKALKRICPVCSNRKGNVLKTVRFYLPAKCTLPSEYDVVSCTECGFTYADSSATQLDYNDYYATFNNYSEAVKTKKNYYDEISPLYKYFVEFLNGIDHISRDSAMIDIGCGGGNLLYLLRQSGYTNISGLDPSQGSIDNLKSQGIPGYVGNIFDTTSEELKNRFDVVISTMVIEHIFDLNRYIDNLDSLVKDDGLIVVNCPAVETYPDHLWPFPNYFNHEHINYFSSVSADNLFGRHGYRRVNSNTLNTVANEGILTLAYKKVSDTETKITKDLISESVINSYLEKIKTYEEEVSNKIKSLNDSKAAIWGAGAMTMQLLAEYYELRNSTEYIIDGNVLKHGETYGKIPVVDAAALKGRPDFTIFVASVRSGKEIADSIVEKGYKNRVVIL